MTNPTEYTILIVDDVVANLRLLVDHLLAEGYQIRVAESGESALKRTKAQRPDLILLDVHMPGMDGFETCRRLKADPDLAPVPVIFLTALDDMDDKVAGFDAGGVDYITKPIDTTEVLLRVRTHLELAWLREQLASSNDRLEREVVARTQTLSEEVARRTRSEEEKTVLLGVVGKQNDQLQKLTHQILDGHARQRAALTDTLPQEINRNLAAVDLHLGRLSARIEHKNDRDALDRIADHIDRIRQILNQTTRSLQEAEQAETALQTNPLLALSEREREVLALTVNGYSTEEIASTLHVTPSTVRSYRYRIIRKLGVKDQAGLLRFAIQHELTSITAGD